MKKLLFFLTAITFFFAACEKQPEPIPEEPLTLKLSADTVYCLPIYKDLPALELAWTAGTNHGTGSGISYTVEMDRAGNNFAKGLKWEIGRTADRTLVFGHKQLADTLALTFPEIPEDSFVCFDWRVRAKVLMTKEEQVSKVVKVLIAWNASMRTALYIIGDAAPNGWNLGQATPMIIDMTDFSVFTWTGNMNKGEFKLLTTNEDWLPCYVSDENDPTKMHFREKEGDYPDFKWAIPYAGNYTIVANTQTLSIAITANSEPEKKDPHLYLIGDATPGGWDLSQATDMTMDLNDSAHFTWNGTLKKGEFKLLTTNEGWLPCYVSDENDPTKMHFREKEEDYPDIKWIIPYEGSYTIDVNIKELKMTIVPPEKEKPHLYLIGDATPGGWDLSQATDMTMDLNDSAHFSWKGTMNKGEFKLLTTKEDWLPCYVRDENDPTKMHFREKEEDYPDFKWEIASAGEYTIDVNTKLLTINIIAPVEPEAYSHIYMIGDATPGGWSWDNITELQHPERNIFTWKGNLNSGDIKFPTEIKEDWSGEMLYAPTPDCAPTENGTFDAHAGAPDNKWRIATAGEYQIRINFNDNTISFVKQ